MPQAKFDFNAMLKKVTDFFRNLPDTIKRAPVDEQAAYGAVGLGVILFLVGIILIVVR